MPDNEKIQRLIKIRAALGYNKAAMARALAMGPPSYWNIETGKVGISAHVEEILIYKLNVNPSYLRNGEGDILLERETKNIVDMKMQIDDLRVQIADLRADKAELKEKIKELESKLYGGKSFRSKAS